MNKDWIESRIMSGLQKTDKGKGYSEKQERKAREEKADVVYVWAKQAVQLGA